MLRACLIASAVLVAVLGCGKKEEESGGGGWSPPTKRDDPTPGQFQKDMAKAIKKGKEAPKVEEKFAGMNEWVQIGDVRVRLTKAAVKKVPLIRSNGSKYTSRDPELMVWVEVENLSKVKKILYGRWGRSSLNKATDEHDNDYMFSEYNGILVGYAEGGLKGSTQDMRPGDPAFTDIICVERPVEAATEVRLALSSQASEKEKYRFRIPAAEWK